MKDPVRFFETEPWRAAVVGLGYVGLPLLGATSRKGLGTLGFDKSVDLIGTLNRGMSHVDDVSESDVARMLSDGVVFTSDPSKLSDVDAIFVCVPSPLGRNREPDLTHIESAARVIAEAAVPGQLVVLESTTYPGTTEDLIVPAVEKAGLSLDKDVWVAYSPERVSPGDDLKTAQIPKVVGGVTEQSGAVAAAAYSRFIPSVHLVSSARVAEMAKLLENTYRAVNIGLINEIAQLSHMLDIDIWEVIDAAKTKPFGFEAFYPGPGAGGHCIPLDPQYLAWSGREVNFATRFIETAEQINARMPSYVVSRAADMLNAIGKPIRGSRLLVVGIAYKPNVSDVRESASLEVANLLRSGGGDVRVLDPVVGGGVIEQIGFAEESGTTVSGYDLAIILTDHDGLPYAGIAGGSLAVLDTRGVYRRIGLRPDNLEQL